MTQLVVKGVIFGVCKAVTIVSLVSIALAQLVGLFSLITCMIPGISSEVCVLDAVTMTKVGLVLGLVGGSG